MTRDLLRGPGGEPGDRDEDEPPLDLSVLSGRLGAGDERAFEALARRIEAAAAPELARRRAAAEQRQLPQREVISLLLARAVRPALLAAAAALLVAAVLGRGGDGTTTTPDGVDAAPPALPVAAAGGDFASAIGLVSDATVARALRVAERDAAWIARQRTPSGDDLATAIGLGGSQ